MVLLFLFLFLPLFDLLASFFFAICLDSLGPNDIPLFFFSFPFVDDGRLAYVYLFCHPCYSLFLIMAHHSPRPLDVYGSSTSSDGPLPTY